VKLGQTTIQLCYGTSPHWCRSESVKHHLLWQGASIYPKPVWTDVSEEGRSSKRGERIVGSVIIHRSRTLIVLPSTVGAIGSGSVQRGLQGGCLSSEDEECRSLKPIPHIVILSTAVCLQLLCGGRQAVQCHWKPVAMKEGTTHWSVSVIIFTTS